VKGVPSGFDANREPEKIQYLVPEAYRKTPHVINKFAPERRTTFYAQENDPKTSKLVMFDPSGEEPEKIQTLIPEAYRTLANQGKNVFNLGTQRSTFNVQLDEDLKFDPAATEPEKIQTLIPEAYRTLANSGKYVFNLGTQRSTFNVQLDQDAQEQSGVFYDHENKIWRTTELLQTDDDAKPLPRTSKEFKASIGDKHIDPWVYDYSKEAINGIPYDGTRNDKPGQEPFDTTRVYGNTSLPRTKDDWIMTGNQRPTQDYDISERFDRPEEAPTKALVNGWPYPQWQGVTSAMTKPSPDYGIEERFPRTNDDPSTPLVNNWPSQTDIGWPTKRYYYYLG